MPAYADKQACRALVVELVQRFSINEGAYVAPGYNETPARTDFITPLLEAFGWDVRNMSGRPPGSREVIEEATVEVGEEALHKKPDYELRLARQRKLYVEAKKPSIDIEHDAAPAFQLRRYGYSANLPISILTSFYQLAVYDCRPTPQAGDNPRIARLRLFSYHEFEACFDELWLLLSRWSIVSGEFDRRFGIEATAQGSQQFDNYFLGQVRSWRKRLAVDIHDNTPGLTPAELTYAVQLFLQRIVFLRICEDRNIENYETLKRLPDSHTFNAFMEQLRHADEFYDSGLFRLLDDEPLGLRISDHVLRDIIAELYYPQSPYTFAVVETEVLGEIYEQFLGEEIVVNDGVVTTVAKPEVRRSMGVVPTPRYIVDAIVDRTLRKTLQGKSPSDLETLTAADICSGSGVFLLSVYEALMEHCLDWYVGHDRVHSVGRTICETGTEGQWRLTFEEKRRILLANIRGVDIDSEAVEVTRFSLLLKLIEDETVNDLHDYAQAHHGQVLPQLSATIRCGNSLVSYAEWNRAYTSAPHTAPAQVHPFDWRAEFPDEMASGGFDVVVGNPPYTRIQTMQQYFPKELDYYKSTGSPYTTARGYNFDKYNLFIERALKLVKPSGRVGMIVPHKFMSIGAGTALRKLVTDGHQVDSIVHFGVLRVFGRKVDNYTCILILDRHGSDSTHVESVRDLESWRYGEQGDISDLPAIALSAEPWEFAGAEIQLLKDHVRTAFPKTLEQVAMIEVGLQTSADPIFIFHPERETRSTVTLRWNNQDWPIERGVLRLCLKDVQLKSYARAQPNAWIIFPYKLGSDHAVHLIQPDEMNRRFPRCMTYLTARRIALLQRNIAGGRQGERQFYQFGRSQSLGKINGPKIVLPVLSLDHVYCFDEADTTFTGGGNGPYYMIRPKPDYELSCYYLMAVLNHPLSEAFIRTKTSSFQGGYYSHGKQFIKDLPVPIPDPAVRDSIDKKVRDLLGVLDAKAVARLPNQIEDLERRATALSTEIESQVSSLFGLSDTDMDVVRAVPVPE